MDQIARPETSGRDGPRARREDDRKAPERTCAATREVRPADELIRFVQGPDGTLAPDLKRELPGRGVWVTATAETVRLAVRKKAFARSLKSPVEVDPALDERVGELMSRATLAMLGFANKAGLVITGFAKVEAALAKENVKALVEATDAGDDGVRKLAQAVRRVGLTDRVAAIRLFSGPQLDLALGRSNVVHAAVLAGPVSAAFLARCDQYARYLGIDGRPAPAHGAGPADEGSGETPAETDRA